MPGMMDTILDLGCNDEVEAALAAQTGDPAFAAEVHRRFAAFYGRLVLACTEDLEDLADLAAVRAAVAAAAGLGYPVLVKAAAGGGGRGMSVAGSDADLRARWSAAGSEAAAAPFRTDEYYAARTAELAALGADGIELEDAAGLLTPDRTRTLVAAIKGAAGGLPVEIHFHSNNALAPLNYLEGLLAGADRVHTASRPLAAGVSLPSTEVTVANLR